MGKMTQGLLGQVTGKVGGMVGSTWKGINTARGYQPNVRNPRSAAQVGNRTAMGMCAKVGSACLGTICVPLWNRFAKGMSGYNAFCSSNKSSFSDMGVLDTNTFDISKGKLFAPSLEVQNLGVANVILSVSPSTDPFALSTDELYVFAWDSQLDENGNPIINFSGATGFTREDLLAENQLLDFSSRSTVGKTMFIAAAFMRADGSLVSNTARYAGLVSA